MHPDLLPLLGNLSFVDEMYARFQGDPASVDPTWRRLFESGGAGPLPPAREPGAATGNGGHAGGTAHAAHAAHAGFTPAGSGDGAAARAAPATSAGTAPLGAADVVREAATLARVSDLLDAFRHQGHLEADVDPIGILPREPQPALDPLAQGFTPADLARVFPAGGLADPRPITLAGLVERMRATYCRTLGVEFTHISDAARRDWLAERMERAGGPPPLDDATERRILERLAAAEAFERFLHTKYVGTKRFSLEGAEMLIPLLDLALDEAGRQGVEEVVMGMAHRGRLNVLVNTLGQRPHEIFAEFEDVDPESALGSGDVKYHLGYSSDVVTRGGHRLHLTLANNPSHLEAVDPVVVGRVRAKQERRGDRTHRRVLGVLLHGDAAFAGQGIVPETLNLQGLAGYRTGGTLHVIVNNQIGFTTVPAESRSTRYASDVAKMVECPIFHVHGEDPEAVAFAVALAMEYRHTFQTDVVLDLFCWRKYGHNEADEPSFTQPLLYEKLRRRQSVFRLDAARLVARGRLGPDEAEALLARHAPELERELALARKLDRRPAPPALGGVWKGYLGGRDAAVPDVDTGVPLERLGEVARGLTRLPEGFHAHPKLARLLAARAAMGRGEQPVDWGMAEALALGSLLLDGTPVRLTGQDSRRGTFSHRHAVVVDIVSGLEHVPLHHLAPTQAPFAILDSPLTELAGLGFEFGYSLDFPDGLVMWEAQFGDFVNGAQIIIDQFLSSSEDKWARLSGLVLLLPHGHEGQGPEHSSARFERFLQLAAEDNLQVTQPTTAAQLFHLLRRQVRRRWRKPLVVLTPKSLLRHPAAASPLADLTAGRFRRLLVDAPAAAADVRRVFLCTGKVSHELADERAARDDRSAIVRLEQLYPWPREALLEALAAFPRARELVWVQEEPRNMGAYPFVAGRLEHLAGARTFRAVSRAESASPATGSSKAHAIEQRTLLVEAFAG